MVQAFEYIGNVSIIVVRFKRAQEECCHQNRTPKGLSTMVKPTCSSNLINRYVLVFPNCDISYTSVVGIGMLLHTFQQLMAYIND